MNEKQDLGALEVSPTSNWATQELVKKVDFWLAEEMYFMVYYDANHGFRA